MARTKLSERELPNYTRKEEKLHSISHAAGALFGVLVLIMCVCRAMPKGALSVTGAAIYGVSMILLYTVSSVYHGLRPSNAKRLMRILDHCTINLLIAGTYTPIILSSILPVSPMWAWIIFGLEWGFGAIATTLTAIDMKKYGKFAMACYIGMGWAILLAAKTAIEAIALPGLLFLLFGGIAYTLGACLYGIGKKHRYFHFVFHIFAVIGSVLQFVCVYFYVI